MTLHTGQIADLLDSSDNEHRLVILPKPTTLTLRADISTSVDIHLGRWFLAPRTNRLHEIKEFPHEASKTSTMMRRVFVPFSSNFCLHPGSFILGGTIEWLKLPGNLAGSVVGKSSWGRRGLVIETASAIHPCFSGCLTLQITNLGETPIVLFPGMAVGQVSFTKIETQSNHGIGRFGGYRRPEIGEIRHDKLAKALMPKHNEPRRKRN